MSTLAGSLLVSVGYDAFVAPGCQGNDLPAHGIILFDETADVFGHVDISRVSRLILDILCANMLYSSVE